MIGNRLSAALAASSKGGAPRSARHVMTRRAATRGHFAAPTSRARSAWPSRPPRGREAIRLRQLDRSTAKNQPSRALFTADEIRIPGPLHGASLTSGARPIRLGDATKLEVVRAASAAGLLARRAGHFRRMPGGSGAASPAGGGGQRLTLVALIIVDLVLACLSIRCREPFAAAGTEMTFHAVAASAIASALCTG